MQTLFRYGVSLLLVSQLVAWPSPAEAQEEAASEAEADLQAMRQSVKTVRSMGAQLYAWLAEADPESATSSWQPPKEVDWQACPAVSAERIRELLEPLATEELVFTDGWGHPLQFCLQEDPETDSWYRAGIRSPGKDGVFQDTAYEPGPFTVQEVDRDMVWVNGYFWSYPSR